MHRLAPLLLLVSITPLSILAQSDLQRPLKLLTELQTASLRIPSIGLGLWNSPEGDATRAVKHAFDYGYHHFDSASAYNNEKYVGAGLNAVSSPPRSTYWITSKLWNTMHKPENVPLALNETLTDLNTTYLDLYLMHWPVAFLPDQDGRTIVDTTTTIEATWKAMEQLVAKNTTHPEPGTTRYIGISNFSPRQIDQVLQVCSVCPYAHEFETHPYLQQQAFVNWHHENKIRVIAYSPLANMNPTYNGTHTELPPILDDVYWKGVAARKNVTVAQAVLGWGVARGTAVIPKSVNPDHIKENLGGESVEFTQEELDDVAQQDKRARFNNPSGEWGVDFFEGLDDGFSPY